MLRRGGGDCGDAGCVVEGRCGTAGRPGLLGTAGRGLAASGFAGAVVCGFSTFGARGFSVRGGRGMWPSCPASDRGAGGFEPLSLPRFGLMISISRHHHPRSFHHPMPTVLQMAIVASDTMKPYFHHSRCVT